jgi:hypothetical protein
MLCPSYSGQYSLQFREFEQQPVVTIRVAAGPVVMGEYVMEKKRFFQVKDHGAFNIVNVDTKLDEKAPNAGEIVIQLTDFDEKSARVHVVSSHFVPEYSFISHMSR